MITILLCRRTQLQSLKACVRFGSEACQRRQNRVLTCSTYTPKQALHSPEISLGSILCLCSGVANLATGLS